MTAGDGSEQTVSGPLAGLRVVEMGQLIAGPFAGQLLGDLGADVVKVEQPGVGDPMRAWGKGAPVQFEVVGRNKRSVSLNLRVPEGQALARRLLADADVLIENFTPGTLEGWGLGPERLLADHPGLIVARMSGYGQTGPYAQRPGYGGVGEAFGGWRRLVGDPDRPAARMGVSIGDSLTAMHGVIGILSALHHRHATGRGQVIDAALYESVLSVMEALIPEWTVAGAVRERSGSILPGIAPSNVYPCRDGELMIGGNGDPVFRRLCAAMGRPELADDPRYLDHRSRGEHQNELDELIAAWTSTLSMAELEARLLEHAVPHGRLFAAADMLADPHYAAREAVVSVPTERWGALPMQGVFPKLSATPGAVRRAAPVSPGCDNAEVLGRLGVTAEGLAALAAKGVV